MCFNYQKKIVFIDIKFKLTINIHFRIDVTIDFKYQYLYSIILLRIQQLIKE